MNEQLIVKNFGPIKDATVDFKRVTVFIGPTGGGKSTLAKLMTVLKQSQIVKNDMMDIEEQLRSFSMHNFGSGDGMQVNWKNSGGHRFSFNSNHEYSADTIAKSELDNLINIITEGSQQKIDEMFEEALKKIWPEVDTSSIPVGQTDKVIASVKKDVIRNLALNAIKNVVFTEKPNYIPAERVFVASLEYSWAGIMRDNIGLPKTLLEFANNFSLSRKEIPELDIPFLNIKYLHINGRDFIRIPDREEPLMLLETASGIQSVTPLLVLLEHLSRNTEQAQSFIIEEPELNLYPTAQQGLLNWLVEKCTQGEDDLTITTHSPYILSSCNLLLEAYKVAQLRPDLEEEIAAIVPKACWLNPDEFAAYYVADGTVKPITDERTHLIGGNELDAVSGDISDSFRKLLRLKKQAV
jgi:predicted ATPase